MLIIEQSTSLRLSLIKMLHNLIPGMKLNKVYDSNKTVQMIIQSVFRLDQQACFLNRHYCHKVLYG